MMDQKSLDEQARDVEEPLIWIEKNKGKKETDELEEYTMTESVCVVVSFRKEKKNAKKIVSVLADTVCVIV